MAVTNATHSMTDADVIVIGAGLSGLQAATLTQEAGLSTIVLEARGEVGGKTKSVRTKHSGGIIDLGAAWINDKTQPNIGRLVKKFGFETDVQHMEGDELLRLTDTARTYRMKYPEFLPPVDSEQRRIFNTIWDDMETDAKTINYHDLSANTHIEDISVGEYMRRKGASGFSLDYWTVWLRVLTGSEPDNIGLVYWLDHVHSSGGLESLTGDGATGGQYQHNRQGNQSFCTRLAAELKPNSIYLNNPVTKITQTDSHVSVSTLSGAQFHASKLLISVPGALLRHIEFSPGLPADKQEFADGVHIGPYSKVVLVYEQPWWRALGLNGSFPNLAGPCVFSRDVSSDRDGMFALSILVAGESAYKWLPMPAKQRVTAIQDQIAAMVGIDHAEKVYNTLETFQKHWSQEYFIEGVPSSTPAPGVWGRLANAARRPYGNVHFIGTETAFQWKGYLDGAVSSGERGAKEVVELLKKDASRPSKL